MDLLSFAIIASIVLAVTKTRKRILRWWHRKKFCESNRGLCRALVTAGFPDFKEYLYFKEDFSDSDKYQSWYEHGCIEFYGSETIVLGSQQYTQKNGKGKADVFANAIKHDYKSPNPTTRWSDVIKLKQYSYGETHRQALR